MIRVFSMCAAACLIIGCTSGEKPKRGVNRGVASSITYQPAPKASNEPIEVPLPEPREAQKALTTTSEQEPKRDLGAELKAALGSPNECIRDFVANSPTTIRISVSGIVRPTGMIIDPTAYGSGLSAAALDCIRERVSRVSLNPLEDATVSETASTVLEVHYEPPVIVEAEPGVPVPNLPDVRHPLPKRPHLPPSGIPIEDPYRGWLAGGNVKHVEGPKPEKIRGPKPRAIDGYEVDENAQEWSEPSR